MSETQAPLSAQIVQIKATKGDDAARTAAATEAHTRRQEQLAKQTKPVKESKRKHKWARATSTTLRTLFHWKSGVLTGLKEGALWHWGKTFTKMWEGTVVASAIDRKTQRLALEISATLGTEGMALPAPFRNLLQKAALARRVKPERHGLRVVTGWGSDKIKTAGKIIAAERTSISKEEVSVSRDLRRAVMSPEQIDTDPRLKQFVENNPSLIAAYKEVISGRFDAKSALIESSGIQAELRDIDPGYKLSDANAGILAREAVIPLAQRILLLAGSGDLDSIPDDQKRALQLEAEYRYIDAIAAMPDGAEKDRLSANMAVAQNLFEASIELAARAKEAEPHIDGMANIDALMMSLAENFSVTISEVTDESLAAIKRRRSIAIHRAVKRYMTEGGVGDYLLGRNEGKLALERARLLQATGTLVAGGTTGAVAFAFVQRGVAIGVRYLTFFAGGVAIFAGRAFFVQRRETGRDIAAARTAAARGEDIGQKGGRISEIATMPMMPIDETIDRLDGALRGLEQETNIDTMRAAFRELAAVDARIRAGDRAGMPLWSTTDGKYEQKRRDRDRKSLGIERLLREAPVGQLQEIARDIGVTVQGDADNNAYIRAIAGELSKAVQDNIRAGKAFGDQVASILNGINVENTIRKTKKAAGQRQRREGYKKAAITAVVGSTLAGAIIGGGKLISSSPSSAVPQAKQTEAQGVQTVRLGSVGRSAGMPVELPTTPRIPAEPSPVGDGVEPVVPVQPKSVESIIADHVSERAPKTHFVRGPEYKNLDIVDYKDHTRIVFYETTDKPIEYFEFQTPKGSMLAEVHHGTDARGHAISYIDIPKASGTNTPDIEFANGTSMDAYEFRLAFLDPSKNPNGYQFLRLGEPGKSGYLRAVNYDKNTGIVTSRATMPETAHILDKTAATPDIQPGTGSNLLTTVDHWTYDRSHQYEMYVGVDKDGRSLTIYAPPGIKGMDQIAIADPDNPNKLFVINITDGNKLVLDLDSTGQTTLADGTKVSTSELAKALLIQRDGRIPDIVRGSKGQVANLDEMLHGDRISAGRLVTRADGTQVWESHATIRGDRTAPDLSGLSKTPTSTPGTNPVITTNSPPAAGVDQTLATIQDGYKITTPSGVIIPVNMSGVDASDVTTIDPTNALKSTITDPGGTHTIEDEFNAIGKYTWPQGTTANWNTTTNSFDMSVPDGAGGTITAPGIYLNPAGDAIVHGTVINSSGGYGGRFENGAFIIMQPASPGAAGSYLPASLSPTDLESFKNDGFNVQTKTGPVSVDMSSLDITKITPDSTDPTNIFKARIEYGSGSTKTFAELKADLDAISKVSNFIPTSTVIKWDASSGAWDINTSGTNQPVVFQDVFYSPSSNKPGGLEYNVFATTPITAAFKSFTNGDIEYYAASPIGNGDGQTIEPDGGTNWPLIGRIAGGTVLGLAILGIGTALLRRAIVHRGLGGRVRDLGSSIGISVSNLLARRPRFSRRGRGGGVGGSSSGGPISSAGDAFGI